MLVANWRDTSHPSGGGSERYVEQIARGLAERGYDVTILCPRHENAPGDTVAGGVTFLRRGGMYTVYLWAMLITVLHRPDLVVEVQNGLPFFCRLVTRRPVVMLVHHLHREQWFTTYGATVGRFGWWIESRVAPRVYRRSQYVTVSETTRAELVALGVDAARVTVVPNGLDPVPATATQRSDAPTLVAVSRLVPHKRLEHAIDAVARLRDRWPALRLDIVGRGHWRDTLERYAAAHGVADLVTFHGWVDEQAKHELLARAWVHVIPSVKEGWGLVVMEAAAHGVPSVAYRSAGGVRESILHGRTGLLADDHDGFVDDVELLLRCGMLRVRMGGQGRRFARRHDWDESAAAFARVIDGVLAAPVRQRRPVPA